MNKSEMVDSLSAKTGLTKADSKRALEAFIESVMECVANLPACATCWASVDG
ncbi:MAG: HU family DNA-binding protein [Chloroflexi bacterium]|nr:HU family DNA-binding protein [Chloroflexota bacterium]